MKNKFNWDDETIQYFVDRLDADGWAAAATLMYKFVRDECGENGRNGVFFPSGTTKLDLFDDLCNKVFEKDIEDNHPWAKAEDDHPHWIEDHRKK